MIWLTPSSARGWPCSAAARCWRWAIRRALAAEATVHRHTVIGGGDAHRAAHLFDALDGVVATYVQGQRLRVLHRAEAAAAVRRHARQAGLKADESQNRLEDAAFVLVKDSLPGGLAA